MSRTPLRTFIALRLVPPNTGLAGPVGTGEGVRDLFIEGYSVAEIADRECASLEDVEASIRPWVTTQDAQEENKDLKAQVDDLKDELTQAEDSKQALQKKCDRFSDLLFKLEGVLMHLADVKPAGLGEHDANLLSQARADLQKISDAYSFDDETESEGDPKPKIDLSALEAKKGKKQ